MLPVAAVDVFWPWWAASTANRVVQSDALSEPLAQLDASSLSGVSRFAGIIASNCLEFPAHKHVLKETECPFAFTIAIPACSKALAAGASLSPAAKGFIWQVIVARIGSFYNRFSLRCCPSCVRSTKCLGASLRNLSRPIFQRSPWQPHL